MITYMAVPFDIGSEGDLIRGEAREAPDAGTAKTWAEAMAVSHVGAMALRQRRQIIALIMMALERLYSSIRHG
ncbi:hypothetical protein M8523_33875, partial [Hyphomicrobiales bacterium BP6-180914]|nr:hypothetical protein [Lichenifustis flavocetrariae]